MPIAESLAKQSYWLAGKRVERGDRRNRKRRNDGR